MKNTFEKTSKLGFGCMRLPQLDPKDPSKIDIEQFKQMVDEYISGGGTYFDTAFVYHNGKSEVALNEALVQRYPRESFTIATKCLPWICKSENDAKSQLGMSLKRLGTDYIDFYLMHNILGSKIQVYKDYGLWEHFKKAKAEGKVRHIGFSLHDNADVLLQLLDDFPEVDFVQIQANYLDWQNSFIDSKRLAETLYERKIPIVVMEPARGGNLINLPENVKKIFTEYNSDLSTASWAYRFCFDIPGVLTVLTGASSIDQMKENMSIFKNHQALNSEEKQVLDAAVKEYLSVDKIPCTACGYCLKGCPQNINIPNAFDQLNNVKITKNLKFFKDQYVWQMGGIPASKCIECGACEEICPQKIDIINQLKNVVAEFEN